MKCKCCNSQNLNCLNIQKKYYFCNDCHSAFLSEDDFVSEEKEIERYSLHNNDLTDNGYKTYLEKFYQKIIEFTGNKGNYLDYGSGPNPCLVQLIREDKQFNEFEVIDAWDLFYTPNFIPKKQNYDVISCLEVAEHFKNPIEDLSNIYSLLKKQGKLILQTQFINCDNFQDFTNFFIKWWYKEDCTHVLFYSKKGIELCAKEVGFSVLPSNEKNIVVFQK